MNDDFFAPVNEDGFMMPGDKDEDALSKKSKKKKGKKKKKKAAMLAAIGEDLNGTIGTLPGSESAGAAKFKEVASAAGLAKNDGPFMPESYDAAALMILAMQAAGSSDRAAIQSNMMGVANAPGEKILPGELVKALGILKSGGQVDYEGASNVTFTDVGEAAGSYKELVVKGGKFETVKIR